MTRITALLVLFPFLTFSQYTPEQLQDILTKSSELELVTENSQLLQEGYLYQAGLVADKLLQLNPQSCNYNYRKGFGILEMSSDYEAALPYLEIAVKDVDKNYDLFSTKEESASTDALYHLARCYHLAENIDKAEEYYTKFIAASSPKSEFVLLTRLRLEQCVVARRLMQTPKKMHLQNVGTTINTSKPEYAPVISLDGSALYFTSRRPWFNGASDKGIDPRYNLHPEDIYVSYRDFDGVWMEPVRLNFCDSIQNEATVAVSSDERRVYVYQDTRTGGNGDIFYSDFSTNRFQELVYLRTAGVNSENWETHCTVTPDGLTMYFVSDRKGGYGGRDIYRVVKMADGKWSEPQNVGPKINGPFDEESPFMAVDNKTLYFSSNGPKSMGGFDVFVSVLTDDQWSDAINLGYPLNSAGDDLFYTTTVDGTTGYLTSFRKNGKGEKDIYEVQNDYLGVKNLALLKGRIKTVDNKPIPEDVFITLRCVNCGDAFDRKVFPRVRDGAFLSSLEPCRQYEMIFSYENGTKEFYKEAFATACDEDYDAVYREILLDTDIKDVVNKTAYYLTGKVKDSKTKKDIPGARVMITYKDGNKIGDFTVDGSGTYTSGALDKKYEDKFTVEVRIEKEGYVTVRYDVPLELGLEPRINLDSYMTPEVTAAEPGTDLGVIADLQPIYFDFAKSNIRPDAKIELDKIVKIMKDNPGIKIELGSHTDSRGGTPFNMRLSDQRAKASADYLIAQGVSGKRIRRKGYGESRLIVSDEVIGKMKDAAGQEAAHQKNRRTEFIIVK